MQMNHGMNKVILFSILTAIPVMLELSGCHGNIESEEGEIRAKAPVTVTSIRTGKMADVAELTATSSFLVKSVVQSPVSGYVEKCSVNPGDKVGKNQLIFRIRTKEGEALRQDSVSAISFSGLIQVKASIDGVIVSIDHPQGDYVKEGDPLCAIVLPESLVFLLEVPFELKSFVLPGNSCYLLLPGGEKIISLVKTALPSMSGPSQTQRVILQPPAHSLLPENLIATVQIIKKSDPHAFILPKACILSDEVMKNFWVMKLINDSTAVKVPVTTGIVGNDSIEILSPSFLPADLFLSSGNYGLSDTALVKVIDKKK
jgi:biotin carboxyl carrier protein